MRIEVVVGKFLTIKIIDLNPISDCLAKNLREEWGSQIVGTSDDRRCFSHKCEFHLFNELESLKLRWITLPSVLKGAA